MTRDTTLAATVLILACSACSAAKPDAPCAEEFYEGSVTFPGGTTQTACGPARPAGSYLVFVDPWTCRVLSGAGAGESVEAGWGVEGDGDWFGSLGPKELWLYYAPGTDTATRCPPGLPPASCNYRRTCQFEVTRAARALGEVVEGHLTAPCTMPDPSDIAGTFTPIVTAMRFRVHISALPANDAGAMCTYPASGTSGGL